MPWHYVMGGLLSGLLLTVHVGLPFQWSMLYPVPRVAYLLSDTNEIRDLTATLLTEVCSQVAVEPELQPVSQQDYPASANIQDGARLDIAMNSFMGWKK